MNPACAAYRAQRGDHGLGRGWELPGRVGDGDPACRDIMGDGHYLESVDADQDCEVVGQRNATSGRHEGLDLDGFVAVTGVEQGWCQVVAGEYPVGERCSCAVVWADR